VGLVAAYAGFLWALSHRAVEGALDNTLIESLQRALWTIDPLKDMLIASLTEASLFPWQHIGTPYGQHDAEWVGFYMYCEHALEVRYSPEKSRQLKLWVDLCKTGWWWPSPGLCICAERPSVVRVERLGDEPPWQRQRLHCEDGPALAYHDGYAIHAIHGVAVPECLSRVASEIKSVLNAPVQSKHRINGLTSEQERQLAAWREQWFQIGVCTQPADRRKAENAISALYAEIGRPAPRFLWVPSPPAALAEALRHTREVIPRGRQPEDRLRDSLGGVLVDSLWDPLKKSLNASLHYALDDSVGEHVYDALWKSLENSLEGSLFFPLRNGLSTLLRARDPRILPETFKSELLNGPGDFTDDPQVSLLTVLGDKLLATSGRFSAVFGLEEGEPWRLHWAFCGQHDVHWVTFYLFCEQVLGVRYEPVYSRQLKFWADLCESGWWAPYDTWCICVERPSVVQMERVPDPQRPGRTTERLHCEDGPALAFRDSIAFYTTPGSKDPNRP